MISRNCTHSLIHGAVLFSLLWAGALGAEAKVEFPGPQPGAASASVRDGELMLANNIITRNWSIGDERLKPDSVTDKLSGRTLQLGTTECFVVVLANGRELKASDLKIVRGPNIETLRGDPKSCRLAERYGGKQIRLVLATRNENLTAEWRAVLRDGSNYIRQHVSLRAEKTKVDLREVVLWELAAPQARPAGTVDGSPAVLGNMFFAFEHPLSKIRMPDLGRGGLRCSLVQPIGLKTGEVQAYSSAIGVVPQGQLRRGFLYYVERERAHPHRPFLHYNSWYDIGYGAEKIRESDALDVIELFGKQLIEQRKVTMDSFVPDDGWDDPASLWQFHEDFPNGFTSLQRRAGEYNSGLGAWLSPWGGYGQAKQARMKYGRQQGFETNKNGFSLAGPKYYARFRDVCTQMVREYELNYFKFDGIGSGGIPTGVDAEFAADVLALLRLIGELRRARADLFVNVTTGTWPSPYWLWYGDSTWRAGRDWGTCGWGSKRRQQITYRDSQTFANVVRRAPLYPLNSLMTQGVMFANHGLPQERAGLEQDIWAFFAGGTNCQELYITPSLLDSRAWDALAEAATWARDNADVLVDTHWVGGDPAKGEVYGWASWSVRKGILALRNPKDEPGTITIDMGEAFELPQRAANKYSLTSPRKRDQDEPAIVLSAGKKHTFELEPFEVLVFDAAPL